MARLVVPNYPHHCTQRGNRRMPVFFSDDDYALYKTYLANALEKARVEVWAYCFMPNHVHLVVVPSTADGLRNFFGEAHRRYTRAINFREGWRGYLWQGRFRSFVMQEQYLMAAVRYVENNPVDAGICKYAEDWQWSSARAHLAQEDDKLVRVKPMLERVNSWQGYLRQEPDTRLSKTIEKHTST
ncbi:MAG: transposase, partial [Gammaproteobacteria bacterium]|nr:transposase [Gammaproteobacteria bacterium]